MDRKSAKIVEINIATSFFWRHKILDCISTFLGKGYIDGVVEADEVFFTESFKGTKPSNMTSHTRKRGKQIFDIDKKIIKAKNFMVQSNVTHSYIKVKDLKNRELMYV